MGSRSKSCKSALSTSRLLTLWHPKVTLTGNTTTNQTPRSTRYSIDIYRSSLECMISQGNPVNVWSGSVIRTIKIDLPPRGKRGPGCDVPSRDCSPCRNARTLLRSGNDRPKVRLWRWRPLRSSAAYRPPEWNIPAATPTTGPCCTTCPTPGGRNRMKMLTWRP